MIIELTVNDDVVGHAEISKSSNINFKLYCIPNDCKKAVVYLQRLEIYPKFKLNGFSKKLITLVKEYADLNNFIICLDAMPLDRTTTSTVLYKIYKDNGFEHCSDHSFTYGVPHE